MICPRRHRPIITEWERPRPWLPLLNQHEANSRAAITDRPPGTPMRDVLRLTVGPTARFIIRHARAFVAAVKAYRSAI